MRPGDLLVTKRSLWADMRGINYLDVWEGPESWSTWAGKWEHHKTALLLEGREIQNNISDVEDPIVMREVLLDGRVVWVVEDEIVEVVT
jgi:hypothetical protein